MAKIFSLIDIRGTVGGMTFVRSTKYGNHVRAPRGSKTPVKLNDAFVASAERMKIANVYAKLIKDGVAPYQDGNKDCTLWTRLIQFFRKQLKEQGGIDLNRLKSFCISANPLSSVVMIRQLHVSADESIRVTVEFQCPEFSKETGAVAYEFGAIALYLKEDNTFLSSTDDKIKARIVNDNATIKYSCALPIPLLAKKAIVILNCLAMLDGRKPSCGKAGTAMEVVEVLDVFTTTAEAEH